MGKRPYTSEEDRLILTLRSENMAVSQICRQLKRSKPSVSYRVYRVLDKLDLGRRNQILGVGLEERIKPELPTSIEVKQEEKPDAIADLIEEDNRQYYFKEIYLPPTELDKLSLNMKPQTENELFFLENFNRVRGKLVARVFELIEQHMTEHQKKIIVLMLKNKTYNNMAILLNINYTAVAHAIKGIKTKKHGKYHGGIERKLRKVCMRDERCLDYLRQIKEAREGLLQEQEESSEVLVEGY